MKKKKRATKVGYARDDDLEGDDGAGVESTDGKADDVSIEQTSGNDTVGQKGDSHEAVTLTLEDEPPSVSQMEVVQNPVVEPSSSSAPR